MVEVEISKIGGAKHGIDGDVVEFVAQGQQICHPVAAFIAIKIATPEVGDFTVRPQNRSIAEGNDAIAHFGTLAVNGHGGTLGISCFSIPL